MMRHQMAWASLLIALGGLIVAAFAVGHTIVRDRAQTTALAEELKERKAADERAEQRQRAASLVAEYLRFESDGHRSSIYTVKVRNFGESPARELRLCLAERLPEGGLSSPVTGLNRLGTIAASDGWVECTLSSPHPARTDLLARPGSVIAYWIDGNGEDRDQEIGRAELLHV